jgi:hypothetical protein
MKNLVAMLVVVLGLGMANVAEAKGGHGGHGGHGGPGRPGVHGHGVGHVHPGFHRANWGNRTWNRTYGRFIFSDPGLPGSYYYSETDKLYYPISMLEVPQGAAKVVTGPGNAVPNVEVKIVNPR